MKVGISLKIDVTKIDKSRIFEGKKGKYLDLTTFVDLDEADEYDQNGFITQSPTKEERLAKTKLPILGNVRVFYKDEASPSQESSSSDPQPECGDGGDIPF